MQDTLTKSCFKCGNVKPLDDFYVHPEMPDGYLNKCKPCARADARANYQAKRSQYKAYDYKRTRTPERRAAKHRYEAKHRMLNPDKYAARCAVSNAIRDGRLVKRPCAGCGSNEVQAHHHDYSKPLDVEWLCFVCHRKEHGQFQGVEDSTVMALAA